MFNYIEKLRGKSDRTKKLVAVGVAALCAGIIFIFWYLSVLPSFGQEKEISDRVQDQTPSPISAFAQIISQGTSGIGDQISKLKSASSGFFGATQIINTATTTSVASTSKTVATSTATTP
jgi:hypothetical protein